MSRVGDSGENEIISQLRGFLRDNLARRPGVGTITRVGLQAVNVKLTETGTLLRAIDVIGGVAGLAEGDTLYLLYFADNRVVGLRPGDLGLNALTTAIAGKADGDHAHPSSFGLHVVLEVKSGATIIYSPDTAGLAAALAAAGSGEVIYIPPFSIAGDISVPAGVRLMGLSRYASVLAGAVTLAADGALENLTVAVAASSSATLVGVVGTASGQAELHDCEVLVVQSGDGAAYALDVNGARLARAWGSHLYGHSASGDGYGVRAVSGQAELFHCNVYGSTDPYLEATP